MIAEKTLRLVRSPTANLYLKRPSYGTPYDPR